MSKLGILLLSQSSILVREKSEGSFARGPGHREPPGLTGLTITQPLTPIPLCLEYLAHVSQAAVGPVVISYLSVRLVWKQ